MMSSINLSNSLQTNAIIEGTVSNHIPYVASITSLNPTQGTNRVGGGSLISHRHVLTSASMLVGFIQFNVAMGSAIRNDLILFPAQGATPHPNYNQQNQLNDIGIITMQNNIMFSSTIQPVQLPRYIIRENEQGMIVGFGGVPNVPAVRLFAAFPRVSLPARCLARWPLATLATQFCAEDERIRSDFCAGDIGNALTILERGVEEIVGIASMPHCLAGASQPSLYTRVISHRAWILQQTGI
ncbi:unnamed protein product [Diamesa hyperborea]